MVLKEKPVKVKKIDEELKREYYAVLQHLKNLETNGYINLKKCPFGFVVSISAPQKNINGYDKNNQKENPECIESSNSFKKNTYSKDVKNKQIKTDIKNLSKAENNDIYYKDNLKTIISYLNEKAEKNFKTSSKKTRELVRARLNEGFNVEDFKNVIEIKSTQWIADLKMNKYLRPETLFGTKFESYLNEKTVVEDREYEGPEYKKI